MDQKKLVELLTKYQKAYYEGKALVSDEEYDILEKQLKKINPNHEFFKKVGGLKGQLEHKRPMLSLDKTYDLKDIKSFLKKGEILVLYKVDGLAISLIYEKGIFVSGRTRGDGFFGEDVTENVKKIHFPKVLKNKNIQEIRAEIFCSEKSFYQLRELGLEIKSQRNVAAGLIKRKYQQDYASYLSLIAYDCFGPKMIKEEEKFNFLKEEKFETPFLGLAQKDKDINLFVEEFKEALEDNLIPVDGLVFVYNDLKLHDLGSTSHHPRYKISYKLQGETKVTKLNFIEWQVGRTGVVTPVGNIEPVFLSGGEISKVSLHHKKLVESFQLKEGDEIEIVRSGEVIPKFLSLVKSSKNEFFLPKKCPKCLQKLTDDGVRLICLNDSCEEKFLQEVIFFSEKMNLENFGKKRLEFLVHNKVIKSLQDLITLDRKDFLAIPQVKYLLADKMKMSLEAIKKTSLLKFLTAFGLKSMGLESLKKLQIETLQDFFSLKKEDLLLIPGFDEKKTHDFLSSREKKKDIIKKMSSYFTFIKKEKNGLNIVITGKTSSPRSYYKNMIEKKGWFLQNQITQETNFLVMNEDLGSKKSQEAKKKGIKVIDEEQLKKML